MLVVCITCYEIGPEHLQRSDWCEVGQTAQSSICRLRSASLGSQYRLLALGDPFELQPRVCEPQLFTLGISHLI